MPHLWLSCQKKCVLLLKRFTLFTYMSVNLSVNTCTHVFWYVRLCMDRGQKRAADPSEVGTGICRMLGSELQSHNYSAKILNCWATSSVTHLILFLKTQAALQLTILLPDSSNCWDDRTVLPCPPSKISFQWWADTGRTGTFYKVIG